MSPGSLTKSSTKVVSLPYFGAIRFSRDSVCTAFTPANFLSTYIATSSASLKPVWNLLATSITR